MSQPSIICNIVINKNEVFFLKIIHFIQYFYKLSKIIKKKYYIQYLIKPLIKNY